MTISLIPLSLDHHVALLQQVYRATPGYWRLYNLPSSPAGQAERDLHTAAEDPGRTLMGIVRPNTPGDPSAGAEMVGMVDFRLHWPKQGTAYLGMIMVAEAVQRQGLATAAWDLLHPWLRDAAGIIVVRAGIEQFNPAALKFCQSLGFQMTGETDRVKVGIKFVRMIYMERVLRETSELEPKTA